MQTHSYPEIRWHFGKAIITAYHKVKKQYVQLETL